MSYFIFLNDSDNIEGMLYRIAENQYDLNNLNIDKSIYKIIEDSQFNFDSVKFGNKYANKYNNNNIEYINQEKLFKNKNELQLYINQFKNMIKQFINNNPNHPLFNRWNEYYDQLNSLNIDNITYPLNNSLEEYFKNQNQPSLSPLQLP